MSRQALSSRIGRAGRCSRRLLAGIAVLAPTVLASAVAAPPDIGLGASARLVSDEELGEMRGKYITAEQANFLGIQLVTAWQTSDGNVLTASLMFEASLVNEDAADGKEFDPTAQLWANVTHGCANCDEGLNLPETGIPAGLTTIEGAVQTNTITGEDNLTTNILAIHIGDFDADSVGFEGDGTGQEVTDAGLTVPFSDGFVAKFEKGPNSLGVVVEGPGTLLAPDGTVIRSAEGLASQSINGNEANQVAQHVILTGDANKIYNSLDVFIGIDQLPVVQLSVENALTSMKGWGF